MFNSKTDTKRQGPFSFYNIGMNWNYPEASYERPKELAEEHKTALLHLQRPKAEGSPDCSSTDA